MVVRVDLEPSSTPVSQWTLAGPTNKFVMTVSQLIELLQQQDPESQVVLQTHGGEETASPLETVWAGLYRANNAASGEISPTSLTDQMQKEGYTEDDILKSGVPTLILSPKQ